MAIDVVRVVLTVIFIIPRRDNIDNIPAKFIE